MAFGDTVGTPIEATGASGEGTVVFSSPTTGNLLVLAIGRSATHSSGGAWGTITGWNLIHDSGINTGNMGAAWWWKISAGTEGTVTTAGSLTQGNWQATGCQFEGPFAVSPFDVAAENATLLSTAGTTISTGTTGTTAQNDALAVAMWTSDRTDTVQDGRAFTNSFTEVIFVDSSSARATALVAKKVLSATGAQESTFTTTDTGDEMYGSIAVFKKLLSGGTTYNQSVGDGTMTPTGALLKLTAKAFTGGNTPAGTLLKTTSKNFGGANTPSGAVTKQTTKTFAGALSSIVGSVTKVTSKTFAGSITPDGAMTKFKVALVSLSGAISTITGTLSRQNGKTLAGTGTSSGVLNRSTTKSFTGSVAPSGSVVKRIAKTFAGTLTSAGSLVSEIVGIIVQTAREPIIRVSRGVVSISRNVIEVARSIIKTRNR